MSEFRKALAEYLAYARDAEAVAPAADRGRAEAGHEPEEPQPDERRLGDRVMEAMAARARNAKAGVDRGGGRQHGMTSEEEAAFLAAVATATPLP